SGSDADDRDASSRAEGRPGDTTLLRSAVLELLARESPLSVREHGREDGLSVDAQFDDPIAAVRAALAIRRRLLADATRRGRLPQATMAIALQAERALELAADGAPGIVVID